VAVQRAWVEEGRIGQTVRHYYYKLLSVGAIRLTNHEKSGKNAYQYVSRLLTDARMDDALPWRAVVDPGRRAFTHHAYKSLAQFLEAMQGAWIPVDVWRDQPRRVEMWVEKDGIAQLAHNAVEDYRVPVYVSKGYPSATVIREAARRYGSGKGWTLLYAGDFDPSGMDIERHLRDTLREHGARPQIERVALRRSDTFLLPPEAALDLKGKDSRTARFVALYGRDQKGYELESLPASQLTRRLVEVVESYMDVDALNEAFSVQHAIQEEVEAALAGVFDGLNERVLMEGLTGTDLAAVRRYLGDPDEDEGQGEL
jgi:hypothetical protein